MFLKIWLIFKVNKLPDPLIVYVLPLPVYPYAKIVPLYPSKQVSTTGLATTSNISSWVAF